MTDTIEYINWFDTPNWSSSVLLGAEQNRYNIEANWNSRNSNWSISLRFGDETLLEGVSLVLGVDLLEYSYSENTPTCALYPHTENDNIERITYENMINGDVRLYHILPENVA